ncbi:hypothetical protein HPP92_009770 [Vanilla planifolia]|uniref:FCP1 homology domain-containing protein n=1 Tax=Vanilla planifolia TaxID=51239 RepID=A0A835V8I1_VANPL|nr:hypothetical protein HPP92_009770 [Vanilla planifolia]
MPALKMPIKSHSNFLRVYSRKSAKILKDSRPHVKSSTKQTKVDSSCTSPWNVSCNNEVSAQNIEITEANDCQDTFIGDSSQLLKLLISSPESTSFREMEFVMASCPMNLEKIFSPGLEQNDGQFIPTIHTDSVEDEQPQLPHLVADEVDDKDCLSEFQAFSSFDFFFSDNLTTLPFDGGIGFSEIIYEDCPYELMNSDAMLDMAESKLANSTASSSSSPPTVVEVEKRKAITLVLDLDETLVHSSLEHCDNADFSFPVFFDMKQHTVYVKRRPYLQTFLERVAQMFHVVIFTASQSIYAERLLNILDPDRKLISQCFYRESCLFSEGSYTKDLTILGIDLAKVAIIDNSPQVFRLQVNNGIPIKSWFDDPTDQALNSLLPFLETLANVDDVRPLSQLDLVAKRNDCAHCDQCSNPH